MDNIDLPALPFTCYSSRRKMFFAFLGSLAFVVAGIYMLLSPDPKNHLALYVSTSIFGVGSLIALFFLIRKIPLFTITEKEIIVGNNKAFIKWNEIAEIRVVKQNIPLANKTYEWVGIFLKDETAYYNTLKPFERKVAASAAGMVGTPIVLNCLNSNIKAEDLNAILNVFLRKYNS